MIEESDSSDRDKDDGHSNSFSSSGDYEEVDEGPGELHEPFR